MEADDELICALENLFRKNKLRSDGSPNEVYSLLYNYRDKRLKTMVKNPEFRQLIFNYYEKIDVSLLTNDGQTGLDIIFDECFAEINDT